MSRRKLKPLKKLNFKPVKQRSVEPPSPDVPLNAWGSTLNLDSDDVQTIANQLGGDYRIARRCAKLRLQYPNATLPELVTLDWLITNNVKFIYLAQIRGGRSRKGGVEADFLLPTGTEGTVWLINGEYWHTRPEVAESDIKDKIRFMSSNYYGIRIARVVVLWEKDIYTQHPEIFELAKVGIGLRN